MKEKKAKSDMEMKKVFPCARVKLLSSINTAKESVPLSSGTQKNLIKPHVLRWVNKKVQLEISHSQKLYFLLSASIVFFFLKFVC